MWCRCKKCNGLIDFAKTRGAKLSERKCKCGGSYESLSESLVYGRNPYEPGKTRVFDFGPKKGTEYYMTLKNSKGEQFYFDKVTDRVILIPVKQSA